MIAVGRLRVRRVSGVISTDDVLPARYKHMHTDPRELAPHIFENLCERRITPLFEGDVLVGDDVFGVGSSREQAVTALAAAGVKAVIAPAFGEIFFRNCWNVGLPALRLRTEEFGEGDTIDLELQQGLVVREADGSRWVAAAIPAELLRMLECGGLIPMVKRYGGLIG